MVDVPEASEPRIFITVERMIGSQVTFVRREIALETYLRARYPGTILAGEVGNMLKEIGWV